MPTVRLQCGWGTVIASNSKDRRIQTYHRFDGTVHRFNMVYFRKKIPILTATIRVFVVDEEIVVLFPVCFQGSQLIRKGLTTIQNIHSDYSSESFIHRIKRYGRASQPI